MTDACKVLKGIMAYEGVSVPAAAKIAGTPYTTLKERFDRGDVHAQEFLDILDSMGYHVRLKRKDADVWVTLESAMKGDI